MKKMKVVEGAYAVTHAVKVCRPHVILRISDNSTDAYCRGHLSIQSRWGTYRSIHKRGI